ncbi:hypothetical protein L1887_60797 [Cichorium endivia]|nr:hypothetical protein L1887_60797 [Cichorium endivia]
MWEASEAVTVGLPRIRPPRLANAACGLTSLPPGKGNAAELLRAAGGRASRTMRTMHALLSIPQPCLRFWRAEAGKAIHPSCSNWIFLDFLLCRHSSATSSSVYCGRRSTREWLCSEDKAKAIFAMDGHCQTDERLGVRKQSEMRAASAIALGGQPGFRSQTRSCMVHRASCIMHDAWEPVPGCSAVGLYPSAWPPPQSEPDPYRVFAGKARRPPSVPSLQSSAAQRRTSGARPIRLRACSSASDPSIHAMNFLRLG